MALGQAGILGELPCNDRAHRFPAQLADVVRRFQGFKPCFKGALLLVGHLGLPGHINTAIDDGTNAH